MNYNVLTLSLRTRLRDTFPELSEFLDFRSLDSLSINSFKPKFRLNNYYISSMDLGNEYEYTVCS